MDFSTTYVTGIGTPTLKATPHGYGANSESGWVNLSWNQVSGASGYTIGIYNGSKYEYHYVGNTTSFTTKGKRLWPTDAEIAAGKYCSALGRHRPGAAQYSTPRSEQPELLFQGYAHQRISYIPDGMTFAEGSVYTPFGDLFIRWERKNDTMLSICAEVPPGICIRFRRRENGKSVISTAASGVWSWEDTIGK